MSFTLPDLPYAYESLAPYLSKETLEYHHDKHHATYVTNANNLLKDSGLEGKSLEEIIKGPARENDGTFNLMGALRTSMATCGYRDIAEFNRAELMVAPALQTEGKQLQREQGVGMGATAAAVGVAD